MPEKGVLQSRYDINYQALMNASNVFCRELETEWESENEYG